MIKSIPIFIASAAVVVLGGCATNRLSPGETKAVEKHSLGPKLETVSYHWDSVGVDVTFSKGDNDTTWDVNVADSWDIYQHFNEQVWGPSSSKCSAEQCLKLVDRSLTQFQAEKPGAQLRFVSVEMHVARELWTEILAALKQRLPTMEGRMSYEPGYVPDEVHEMFRGVLDKSETVAQINALLKKHGLDAQGVSIANQLMFKTSLSGRKWSEIGSLPDLGIEIPGAFEFDFNVAKARIKSVSDQPLPTRMPSFHSSRLERELNFYVARHSEHATNHFYVGATKLNHGQLVEALVYWKEERMLLPYTELEANALHDVFAWQGHGLKLDRDTVDTPEDVAGSTYLVTHQQWAEWTEQCILKGKSYCVLATNAHRAFPAESTARK